MSKSLKCWGIAIAGAVVLVLPGSPAQARDMAEARAAVTRSSEQSLRALDGALGQVSGAEAQAAIERARTQVLEAREQALRDLDRAERGFIPDDQGLEKALMATNKHQSVLDEVLGRVPDRAKDAIRHAMEVSRHGTDTIAALRAGMRGQELPAPTLSPPPGREDRPSSPVAPPPPGGRGGVGRPGGAGLRY